MNGLGILFIGGIAVLFVVVAVVVMRAEDRRDPFGPEGDPDGLPPLGTMPVEIAHEPPRPSIHELPPLGDAVWHQLPIRGDAQGREGGCAPADSRPAARADLTGSLSPRPLKEDPGPLARGGPGQTSPVAESQVRAGSPAATGPHQIPPHVVNRQRWSLSAAGGRELDKGLPAESDWSRLPPPPETSPAATTAPPARPRTLRGAAPGTAAAAVAPPSATPPAPAPPPLPDSDACPDCGSVEGTSCGAPSGEVCRWRWEPSEEEEEEYMAEPHPTAMLTVAPPPLPGHIQLARIAAHSPSSVPFSKWDPTIPGSDDFVEACAAYAQVMASFHKPLDGAS